MNVTIGAMPGFRWRALLAYLLIGGFLLFSVYKSEAARAGGAEIILETRPIDPRDIFFGHYAILGYDIQSLTPGQSYELMDAAFKAEADKQSKAPDEERPYNQFQSTPAYIVLKKDGGFDRADFATLDLANAQAAGKVFLKANWSVSPQLKKCEADLARGDDCGWRVSIFPDLPGRYYADKETALALQNLQRDAQLFAREQPQFDDCERPRAAAGENDPAPSQCANAAAPPSEAEKFGVVLSASRTGEAVIKGIVFGDQKAIDSLTGPRLTTKEMD